MKTLTGIVTSSKTPLTVTVKVSKLWQHPIYGKRVKRSKNFLVHNDIGAKEGDSVVIGESRPISKNKHFKITKIIKKPVSL